MGNNHNFCHLPYHPSTVESGEEYSNACNSERVSEMITEKRNFLSSRLGKDSSSSREDLLQLQQLRCQQISQQQNRIQFDELSEAQSWGQTSGNQCDATTLEERSVELPHLHLEERCKIQQQLPCLVQHAETAKIVDSNNISQHEVLLLYANFNSFPQNAGRKEDAFLKDLHSRTCNGQKCNCDQYRSLISHYDNCHNGACRVCRPFQELSSTDSVRLGFEKSRTNLSKALHGRECNINCSPIAEDIQPPPKRTRIEGGLMSENELSSLVDLLEDRPSRNKESSNSGKSSEGHADKENTKEINGEHLNTIESPTKAWLTANYNSAYIQSVKYDNPVLSEELNNEYKSGLTNSASECKNRNIWDNGSQGMDCDILSVFPGQPNCNQEKEGSHFMSKPGQVECKGGGDSVETAAYNEPRNNLENTKVLAVSLTDCFNAEQIKEHICSLNPLLGQVCAISFATFRRGYMLS